MNPLMVAGGIMSGIGAVDKFFTGKKLAKQGRFALGQRGAIPMYKESPYAKQQLGMAQGLLNARMGGASQLERNIFQNQANFMGNVNRNATDGSQALALAAASQGMTNDALGNLQVREDQNKVGMLDNLNRAYGQMINEGDKVHQSQTNRYNMLTQEGLGLLGAGKQNQYGAMNDMAGTLFGMGQLGVGGKRGNNGNSGGAGGVGWR